MRLFFRGLALVALVAIALAALGAVIPRPLFSQPMSTADGPDAGHQILLLSNPIHTDIALRLDDDLRQRFAFLREDGLPLDAGSSGYLVFGWGGRSFYLETPTWAEAKPMPVLKGLTLDRSAMHVTLTGEIDPSADFALPLNVSGDGYLRLLGHIEASFVRSADRPVLIAGAGYGDNDLFYEAKGRFTALLGCNTWTAKGLREAGLRTGWWNPLPMSLRFSLEKFNKAALKSAALPAR